jgi:hypothetical protein
MGQVERSQWGDDQTLTNGQDNGGGQFGLIPLILGGLLSLGVAVIAYMLSDSLIGTVLPRPADTDAPNAETLVRIAFSLIAFTGTLMVVLLRILPDANTVRMSRVLRIALFFVMGGIALAATVYIGMGFLLPLSTVAERLILPILIAIFFIILAFFSPFMPIWRINVPDGEVWMIFDSDDHLRYYIGPGVRMIRPIDGYEPYDQKGVIKINIDDESYVSEDYFPFRVRVAVVCSFNPLNAEEYMWVPLRGMQRAVLQESLQTEIEFLIRHRVVNHLRAYIRDKVTFQHVLNSIAMDIREAVESRRHMGISLLPINPINVILDAPELTVDTRQRHMSVEALATGQKASDPSELGKLMQLIADDSELDMLVDPNGGDQIST